MLSMQSCWRWLPASVEIGCGAVAEANLSLLQLIIAARASAREAGRTVVLAQPTAGALLETLSRGGFLAASADQSNPDQTSWLAKMS